MKVQFIENDLQFADALQILYDCDTLAIDLEFDKNMFRYGFNLCLMQIKVGDHCFLIDPLSDKLNINSIFPILEDPSKQKIVFAFSEDLRLLHSINCTPKNMFDLSVAASLLNYPPISLTNLIHEVLGITVGKSAQRSNWYTRPLSDEQLNYAAEDVLFLHKLRAVFKDKAQEKGIAHWMVQEIEELDKLSYHGIENNEIFREKDKQGLTQVNWFVFQRLIEYREELAKKINRPSYQIIDKDFLISLAKNLDSIKGWERARVNPNFKTVDNKNALSLICDKALTEANNLGLSSTKSAIERLSKEEFSKKRKQQQLVEEIKTTIFRPIKTAIAADYGENTAAYLLSSKTMENIIVGKLQGIPAYRLDLVKNYAKTFGLNVAPYIQ